MNTDAGYYEDEDSDGNVWLYKSAEQPVSSRRERERAEMEEETVIVIPAPKGEPCPRCNGFGRYWDGFLIVGTNQKGETEFRSRPGTTCGTCNGKGRVRITITPID